MPRKQKKYHYIYKTTCSVNKKYYIGMHSTNDLDDEYLGSGKKLWNSINYYGKENFTKEIIEFCNNREQLKKREKEIVNVELLNEELCMNMVVGGGGGFLSLDGTKKGRKNADKVLREKYGDNFRKIINGRYSKKLKEDKDVWNKHSNKIKEGHKRVNFDHNTFGGRVHLEESVKKMKETHRKNDHQKGEKNSNYGTMWVMNLKLKKNKRIQKSELQKYINKGWVEGRQMKF